MTERRKKLIEVALPLEAINKESAREKEPFTRNHPRSLHIWWARRPLVACRAVLFASLVDDPSSDPAYRGAGDNVDEERAGLKRAQLFNLIEELVKWENSNNDRVINAARAEIARCVASRLIEEGKLQKDTIIHGKDEGKPHPKGPISGEFRTAWDLIIYGNGDLEALDNRTTRLCPPDVVNHFLATYAPPVLDPFAGGGSIPLEAQRLGLRAYASDLNPVPVLINKALIEIPPKFANQPPVNPDAQKKLKTARYHGAQGLAEDVRYYGKWMRDEAEKRIGHLYPKVKIAKEMAKDRPDLRDYVGQDLPVIGWLWARTVKSPNPAMGGVQVPLVKSFWLSKKKGKEAYVRPVLDPKANAYSFAVNIGKPSDRHVTDNGTKVGRGCKFVCLLSGQPIPEEHVKAESQAGRLGVKLMAIVVEGKRERLYLSPTPIQEEAAHVARPDHLDSVESTIAPDKRAIWCLLYGLDTFDKLFSDRQLTALSTFIDLLHDVQRRAYDDAKQLHEADGARLAEGGVGAQSYSEAVVVYLAIAVSRWTDLSNAICSWNTTNQNVRALFARQGIPMSWDFVELSPFSSVAPITSTVESAANSLESLVPGVPGDVRQLDATAALGLNARPIVSTDPPYYDNIGYADLSDFFYVWLRKALSSIFPTLFATMLTPKTQELIASPYRHDGSREAAQEFFEDGLETAFRSMREIHPIDYPLTVYYAFKQSEAADDGENRTGHGGTVASTGWETMLNGLISSGFSILGTWPMRTERGTRSVGLGTNALASCIVLACRPRSSTAPLATRREFLSALKQELPVALKHLQQGSIAPVDLAQAAIGPGMSIFSRYSKIVESDGAAMTVRTGLMLINQILDEVLAEQEGEFDGDTRWAVAWFEQHGVDEGPFGVAETLSKAKNTSVQGLVDAGVVEARSGNVKLLSRDDMPDDWDPTTDKRPTCWEATQHLIRRLQNDGEQAAADLLARLGGDYGEMARDLAYRLYSICERKGWAQEALAYNSLVIAWSEISKLSRTASASKPAKSAGLFE